MKIKRLFSLLMAMLMLLGATGALSSCDIDDLRAVLEELDIRDDLIPEDLESLKDLDTDRFMNMETDRDGESINTEGMPYVGPNGNWWIGDYDTGVPYKPADGETETNRWWDEETETNRW